MKLIYALLLFSVFTHAVNRQETFLRANKCYTEGDCEQALSLYDSLNNKGRAVWYNMGNCHYQKGNYARAISCWERARVGAPWHESQEIDANVQLALRKLGKVEEHSLLSSVYRLGVYGTRCMPLFFLQLLFLLFWYVFFFLKIRNRAGFLRLLHNLGGGALCIVLGVAVCIKTIEQSGGRGIIIEQTPLFVGPNERYQRVDSLVESDLVTVKERKDHWCKVHTKNAIGWVPAHAIEVV